MRGVLPGGAVLGECNHAGGEARVAYRPQAVVEVRTSLLRTGPPRPEGPGG